METLKYEEVLIRVRDLQGRRGERRAFHRRSLQSETTPLPIGYRSPIEFEKTIDTNIVA